MHSELLKTILEKNNVDFSCMDVFSETNTSVLNILKKSQVDCTVLTFNNEFFIALNPATHTFDLSRLNKITGKSLSRIDNEEQIIKDSNRKVHVFIDEALENQDDFFILCEEEKNAYSIDIKQLHKLSNDNLIG